MPHRHKDHSFARGHKTAAAAAVPRYYVPRMKLENMDSQSLPAHFLWTTMIRQRAANLSKAVNAVVYVNRLAK